MKHELEQRYSIRRAVGMSTASCGVVVIHLLLAIDPAAFIHHKINRNQGTTYVVFEQFINSRWCSLQHDINKLFKHYICCSLISVDLMLKKTSRINNQQQSEIYSTKTIASTRPIGYGWVSK